MKESFIELLTSTKRDGVDELIVAMDEGGFFEAPCSTSHHLAKEGGLLEHSLNVCEIALKLAGVLGVDASIDSIILVSLLHDLGKMGDHGKANYIKAPLLKSGKEPAKPWMTNPELIYEEHEIRSYGIANRYIYLTEEEENAILHHNGCYGKLDSSFSSYYDKHQLTLLLHMADMWASRFVEV